MRGGEKQLRIATVPSSCSEPVLTLLASNRSGYYASLACDAARKRSDQLLCSLERRTLKALG
jgi:hypothetical protein